ncbi:MAG: transporter, partial [Paenibacillus sp.]|nr:transporter [Paenibacillus sp.]
MIVCIIYIISAINQMIVSGTKPVVSLYASKLGATPLEIGIIVSVFAFLPAFLAIHIGKWIDHYGIRRLVSLGGGGLLIALLAPVLYPHFYTFVFSQGLMGVAFTFQVVALQKKIGNT